MSTADNECQLDFRQVTEEDCRLLFNWANESQARQNAFNPDPISWDEHRNWFERQLNNSKSRIYIAEAGEEPIGQIRFEKQQGVAVVSVSVDSDYRGQGFGEEIIHQGSERYLSQENLDLVLEARIKKDNEASVKAFHKAGYDLHRQDQFNGLPALVYRYSAD